MATVETGRKLAPQHSHCPISSWVIQVGRVKFLLEVDIMLHLAGKKNIYVSRAGRRLMILLSLSGWFSQTEQKQLISSCTSSWLVRTVSLLTRWQHSGGPCLPSGLEIKLSHLKMLHTPDRLCPTSWTPHCQPVGHSSQEWVAINWTIQFPSVGAEERQREQKDGTRGQKGQEPWVE